MARQFFYGGQALIEGVMMRGQKTVATAVRHPNGDIIVDNRPLSTMYTGNLRRTPFIRGIIVLIETLILGTRSLFYSANVALGEEGEEVSGWVVWVTVAFALALAVALFFLAPLFLTKLLNIESSILFNLTDGVIRVVIFVAYLSIMTLVPDIKRVWAYHGAEHKTINAYEAGMPLEVEAVKEYGTAHRRCGTSFLVLVIIISIIVFSMVGVHAFPLMALSRIILIPVIAGLSYEVIYFGARHVNNRWVRAVLAPGMWLQSITTREPDDSQLEVALTALREVVAADQAETEHPALAEEPV